jgi:hypothetical protein
MSTPQAAGSSSAWKHVEYLTTILRILCRVRSGGTRADEREREQAARRHVRVDARMHLRQCARGGEAEAETARVGFQQGDVLLSATGGQFEFAGVALARALRMHGIVLDLTHGAQSRAVRIPKTRSQHSTAPHSTACNTRRLTLHLAHTMAAHEVQRWYESLLLSTAPQAEGHMATGITLVCLAGCSGDTARARAVSSA